MWRHTGWRHKNGEIFFFFLHLRETYIWKSIRRGEKQRKPLFDTTRELWGFKNILAPPPPPSDP